MFISTGCIGSTSLFHALYCLFSLIWRECNVKCAKLCFLKKKNFRNFSLKKRPFQNYSLKKCIFEIALLKLLPQELGFQNPFVKKINK